MIYADDTILVELVRSGRRDAFDEIDRRYRGKLCRMLTRQTNSPHLAEELTQQTLIRAYETIDSFPEQQELSAWLGDLALRQLRRRTARPEPIVGIATEELPVVYADPSEEMEQRDDEANVWILAKKILTDDEYTAVWLKYVDGYKVDQIARTMARSRISVRVLLFRARRKLFPVLDKR